MRKDIEDGRADKQKKKEDESKQKGRKGKNAHDKDKNGLTEDDKKKHKTYAAEIVQKLKADKGNNAKSFKEFHASKVKLAKDLEGRYQKKLKRGINIDITIPPLEKDKKDNDVDFKIKIAPNSTQVSDSTGEFSGDGDKFKKDIDKAHEMAKKAIKNAMKAKSKKIEKLETWAEVVKEIQDEGALGKMVSGPLSSHDFGKDVVKNQGVPAAKAAMKNTGGDEKYSKLGTKPEEVVDGNKANIHGVKDPFAKSLGVLKDFIFNGSLGGQVLSTLTSELAQKLEKDVDKQVNHMWYFPEGKIDSKKTNDGKTIYNYKTRTGKEFTAVVNKDELPESITGANLKLDGKGRGKTQNPDKTGKPENHDSSHLIANMFGGSGYKKAANLIATSPHYNQVVMRGTEDAIRDELIDKDIDTFNMKVDVKWRKIDPQKIIKKIKAGISKLRPGERDAKIELQDLEDAALTKHIMANLGKFPEKGQMCAGVKYEVWGKTKDGESFKIKPPALGPDIWLGL